MKKVLLVVSLIVMIGLQALMAQTSSISGTVTDAGDGSSIPGVSVFVKGTSVGTITQVDGTYHLEVPEGSNTMVFSFVGMTTQEVLIDGKSTINVSMKSDAINVDEVMVVAYGTTKKSSFTGSASNIKAEEITKRPVASVAEAISGLASGVVVGNVSGQPGAQTSIRIRGTGSINSSKDPLFVIDGVPTSNSNVAADGDNTSLGVLSSINPSDIESITVLKDAASASLYGSRAANGVILITTKRGKAGKTNFSFKTETGVSDFAVKTLELASPAEAYEYKVMGLRNWQMQKWDTPYDEADTKAREWMADDFPDYDPSRPDSDYDWHNALFDKGAVSKTEFSASGGTEKTRFFASLGYSKNEGVAKGSAFERFSGRLNLDHKANESIEFGFNLSLSRMVQDVIISGGNLIENPLASTRNHLNQLTPIKTADGEYTQNPGGDANLVEDRDKVSNTNDVWVTSNQGYLNLNLAKGLSLRSTNGLMFTNAYGNRYWSPSSNNGVGTNGYAYARNKRRLKLTTSNILNYIKTINGVHNIDLIAGYEAEDTEDDVLFMSGTNFPSESAKTLDTAAKPTKASETIDGDRMQSMLSRFNYNYDGKYYASLSYRTDASSRLGTNSRWGNFYSVSGSWRISSEPFMQGVEWVNDLKLRASYGVNGTLPDDWVASLELYEYGYGYNSNPGSAYYKIANEDLEWEKNATTSIAVEARIFDFLSIEAEYYQRKTTDLLLEVPLSRTTGFENYWDNVGAMTNKGFELNIKTVNFATPDFTWQTNVFLSRNTNEITKLVGGDQEGGGFILREGESYNTFWDRDWAGVNPDDGTGLWYVIEDDQRVDNDGDGQWDTVGDPLTGEANRTIVGCADPDLTGSINNTLSYKGIDLSFLFTFQLGGDSRFGNYGAIMDDGWTYKHAVSKMQLEDVWMEPGDQAKNPKVIYGSINNTDYSSSRKIVDGSYLRLKNINLGYSLPKSIVSKAHLSNVRFYVSGSNLLTFSKIDHLDPETNSRGNLFNNWDFPPLKTYTFGVQVDF